MERDIRVPKRSPKRPSTERLFSKKEAKSIQDWLEPVFTFHFHALEKVLATHSSVLAWRMPGMGEPGGLLSMGLHRVGHD